ncbi:hypothetical protein N9W21_02615 [Shewanella sp.]|nr:hypothetical protein [Shewanella sp.]
MSDIKASLDNVNIAIDQLLEHAADLLFEDEKSDTLVFKLHEAISARQHFIDQLVGDSQFEDKQYLQQQVSLTEKFAQQATIIRVDREALLRGMRKGQQQTNLYKTINAKR